MDSKEEETPKRQLCKNVMSLLGHMAVPCTIRPIVTDSVAWFVGWSVDRSVCHTSEPCRNGWTNWDAAWV